jgi:hypothetical protein
MAKLGDINSQTDVASSAYERYTVAQYGGSVSAGTPQEISISTFTMPFTGTIFLNGLARWDPLAGQPATVTSALIEPGPTSVPAVTTQLQWVGAQAPANSYYESMPFSWKWSAVPSGTAVNLKIKYTIVAASLVLTHVAVNIRIVATEF